MQNPKNPDMYDVTSTLLKLQISSKSGVYQVNKNWLSFGCAQDRWKERWIVGGKALFSGFHKKTAAWDAENKDFLNFEYQVVLREIRGLDKPQKNLNSKGQPKSKKCSYGGEFHYELWLPSAAIL